MNVEMTLKYNSDCQTVFKQLTGAEWAGQSICDNLKQEIIKAYTRYIASRKIIKPEKKKKENTKKEVKLPVKVKKSLTYKQRQGRRLIADCMQMRKADMISHIKALITDGVITWQEFVNDPTVYYDKQILCEYYNNYIIRKSIESYFKNQFIPF
jgi:hypothetical protein